MLYFRKDISPRNMLAIWHIEENKRDLLAMLNNKGWYTEIENLPSETRSIEKLAVRVLLKEILQEEKQIFYSEQGMPYLKDSAFNISISHTKNFAAILLGTKQNMGIDIEQITEKVKRVKDKFITFGEQIDPDKELNHLLIHWSAKEALFKAFHRQISDLKNEVIIQPFCPEESGKIFASVIAVNKQVEVHYSVTDAFVLSYCLTNWLS